MADASDIVEFIGCRKTGAHTLLSLDALSSIILESFSAVTSNWGQHRLSIETQCVILNRDLVSDLDRGSKFTHNKIILLVLICFVVLGNLSRFSKR